MQSHKSAVQNREGERERAQLCDQEPMLLEQETKEEKKTIGRGALAFEEEEELANLRSRAIVCLIYLICPVCLICLCSYL
ncbi:hypothetical protein LOK49_LG08G01104 [Camellia lanceoleosa]|uniref:Uncharacterized protein n=1 Tax=Camellia lanceoleosa TaxID=1840588 RepID=A0ACC0GMQ5_9ERIC|nr:hypothetical protein LOK49_LG08G01104 [Camellia lanceoleosa]